MIVISCFVVIVVAFFREMKNNILTPENKKIFSEAISKVFKNGRKFLLRSANGAFSACPP